MRATLPAWTSTCNGWSGQQVSHRWSEKAATRVRTAQPMVLGNEGKNRRIEHASHLALYRDASAPERHMSCP